MRLSFKTPPQHTDWPSLLALWRAADEMPILDAGWTFDHLYPYGGDRSGPVLEGWIAVAALAAATHRLRLGVLVTNNLLRHPSVLAKMAATLDHVSDGRLELGIGAGGDDAEHGDHGLDLPAWTERFDRLDEACAVLDLLLTQGVVDFAGRHYRLAHARCDPKPVQRPRPPLVVGGRGERRLLAVVARWADQWNFPGGSADELRSAVSALREHCRSLGRDPASIEISAQVTLSDDARRVAAESAELAAAGADHIVLNCWPPCSAAALARAAEAVAEHVRAPT